MNLTIEYKYNAILIMIDKFIKYLHIIVYTKKFIVEQLKDIVFNRFIQYYNILKKLINNKNKLFTSNS